MSHTQSSIQYTEAKAYALANPRTSAAQLRERFEKISAQQSKKLVWIARKRARDNGMVIEHDPARKLDPIYTLAKEYGNANPTITPTQLRQLFPINRNQSQQIMCRARKAAGVDVIPPAARSKERTPNPKQAAIMADAARRRAEAIEYARQNPNEHPTRIAERFRVPSPAISAFMRAERDRKNAEEQRIAADRRKKRRLHAVFADGSTVDPGAVKDWTNWIGFTKVMV